MKLNDGHDSFELWHSGTDIYWFIMNEMASSVEAFEKHQIASDCGICLEIFRNPRRLPCSHSFCEECLENWIGHNKETLPGEIVCPRCKKNTEIPSKGVKGFPPVKIMEKVRLSNTLT